jgi:hypothetical protein
VTAAAGLVRMTMFTLALRPRNSQVMAPSVPAVT